MFGVCLYICCPSYTAPLHHKLTNYSWTFQTGSGRQCGYKFSEIQTGMEDLRGCLWNLQGERLLWEPLASKHSNRRWPGTTTGTPLPKCSHKGLCWLHFWRWTTTWHNMDVLTKSYLTMDPNSPVKNSQGLPHSGTLTTVLAAQAIHKVMAKRKLQRRLQRLCLSCIAWLV